MKCSLRAVAVLGRAVLPQLVLAGANFGFAEAAAPQFHHGPLQLAGALPLQQTRRQFPVGALGEQRRNLGPRDSAAADIPAAAARFLRIASRSSSSVSKLPISCKKSSVSSGSFSFLTSSTSNSSVDFLAAQLCVRRVLAERDFGRARVAALHALHQLVEAFEPRIAEAQRRTNAHDRFGLVRDLLAVGRRRDVDRHIIAFRRRAFVRHELAVARPASARAARRCRHR